MNQQLDIQTVALAEAFVLRELNAEEVRVAGGPIIINDANAVPVERPSAN